MESRVRAVFGRSSGVVTAYLFGSHGRGEATPGSDVDVAVLFEKAPAGTLGDSAHELAGELERELGREVDLVVLNHAAPDLTHRVLRDGVLVCENDRSARIAFEIHARNQYFDLVPFLQRYRRATG